MNACMPLWVTPLITIVGMLAAYWTAERVGRRNRGADSRKRRVDRVIAASDRVELAYSSYRFDGESTQSTHELNAALRLLDQSVALCDDGWVSLRVGQLKDGLRLYYLMLGQPEDPLNEQGAKVPSLADLRGRTEALAVALRRYEDG